MLKEKLQNKTAVLGVVGLGYVGLPLAVEKAKAGYSVIGFDIQHEKVMSVNAGHNYIGDIVDEELGDLVRCGRLKASEDFSKLSECDCVSICVPTPLDTHQQPDLSYVESTAKTIRDYLRNDMLIVLESTTYPGTTQELLLPILESTGLCCGKDFYLAFSPERVDPGNAFFKTKNTPKVVGGITAVCTDIAATMYERILEAEVFRASSPAVAEMEKILENTYRNINIGLINEMAMLCNKMGISIWEVVDAAKTKPYGFQAFYPGPGIGGHCIPIDPYYLSWKAREYGFHTSMIEASMMINDRMPEYCIERASRILNHQKKALNGSRILLMGIAYKQDTDDYRESPALQLMEGLGALGVETSYHDPFIPTFMYHGMRYNGLSELTPEILQKFDLIIISTAHTIIDYRMIQQHAKAVFDTKNAMKHVSERGNIELL